MLNPRLATRYARSLLQISQEQGKLDAIQKDMTYLRDISRSSAELRNFLKSPVIQADKKIKALAALLEQQTDALSFSFIQLLIRKGREALLPEIAEAFITLCYEIKGIHRVKLTTAHELSSEMQQKIVEKVKQGTAFHTVELEAAVNDELIGGFQIEFNGQLVDASIARDLRDVQSQFQSNSYIHDIR